MYHFFFKQFNSKFDFRQKWIEFNIGKPKFKQPINWKRILSCFFFFPDFLKIRIFPEFMKFGWQHVSACCPNLVVDWIGFTIGYGVSTARRIAVAYCLKPKWPKSTQQQTADSSLLLFQYTLWWFNSVPKIDKKWCVRKGPRSAV